MAYGLLLLRRGGLPHNEPRMSDESDRRKLARERFRPRERIQSRADFDRVFKRRCRVADRALAVYVDANGLDWSRLGLSVSKRVGGAVTRNYVKRRIREAFRRLKFNWPGGFDIVCVAMPPAGEKDFDVSAGLYELVSTAMERYSRRRESPRKDGTDRDTPAK